MLHVHVDTIAKVSSYSVFDKDLRITFAVARSCLVFAVLFDSIPRFDPHTYPPHIPVMSSSDSDSEVQKKVPASKGKGDKRKAAESSSDSGSDAEQEQTKPQQQEEEVRQQHKQHTTCTAR
jgi:hypothetical protein